MSCKGLLECHVKDCTMACKGLFTCHVKDCQNVMQRVINTRPCKGLFPDYLPDFYDMFKIINLSCKGFLACHVISLRIVAISCIRFSQYHVNDWYIYFIISMSCNGYFVAVFDHAVLRIVSMAC